jgi:hypothetical protein
MSHSWRDALQSTSEAQAGAAKHVASTQRSPAWQSPEAMQSTQRAADLSQTPAPQSSEFLQGEMGRHWPDEHAAAVLQSASLRHSKQRRHIGSHFLSWPQPASLVHALLLTQAPSTHASLSAQLLCTKHDTQT